MDAASPMTGGGRRVGAPTRCKPGTASVRSAGTTGQLAGSSVGIDAAHLRWFAFDGPDDLDNGLALCALRHKLFDRGVLGLDPHLRVLVSAAFTARTTAGRSVYELHGRALAPRPGTGVPADSNIAWHAREVFIGELLAA